MKYCRLLLSIGISVYTVFMGFLFKSCVCLANGRALRCTPITPWTLRTTTTAPCPPERSLACPCLTLRTCRQGPRVSSAGGRMARLAQAPQTGTGRLQREQTAQWCAGAEVRPETIYAFYKSFYFYYILAANNSMFVSSILLII